MKHGHILLKGPSYNSGVRGIEGLLGEPSKALPPLLEHLEQKHSGMPFLQVVRISLLSYVMLKIKPKHINFTHQLANSVRELHSQLIIYALEVRVSEDTVMFPSPGFDKYPFLWTLFVSI